MDDEERVLVSVKPETRHWARRMIDNWHAVEELHTARPRYMVPGGEAGYEDPRDALALLQEDIPDATMELLETFLVCEECARVEESFAQAHGMTDWGFVESIWPCATVKAMEQ